MTAVTAPNGVRWRFFEQSWNTLPRGLPRQEPENPGMFRFEG